LTVNIIKLYQFANVRFIIEKIIFLRLFQLNRDKLPAFQFTESLNSRPTELVSQTIGLISGLPPRGEESRNTHVVSVNTQSKIMTLRLNVTHVKTGFTTNAQELPTLVTAITCPFRTSIGCVHRVRL